MAKATSTGQEVAPVKNTALEEYDLSYLTADAGIGNENVGIGDVGLPFLSVLQPTSPQIIVGGPAYVEGATASMFYDNVSQQAHDGRKTGLDFIACYYERKFVEWVDRDRGGGWVADYEITSDILRHTTQNDKKQNVMPSGNLIIETAYHYGLYRVHGEDDWFQCCLPLKSTMLKLNRKWNNELSTTKIPGTDMKAPRWLYAYHLLSELKQKNGNSWFIPTVDRFDKPVPKVVYEEAKKFHMLVKSGIVRRNTDAEGKVPDAAEIDPNLDIGSGPELDNEIPF